MSIRISTRKDKLQIYLGEGFTLGKISIRQPTMREIVQMGEAPFFNALHSLISTPSDAKSFLWDNGRDWTEMDRLEFFYLMTRPLTQQRTSILLGDLDLASFALYKREDGDLFMYDQSQDIVIDLYSYTHICDYLCNAFLLKQTDVKPGTEFTKKMMIEMDREEQARKKSKEFESSLYPLISAMVNHPAFKYKISEVMDLTYFQFLDSVHRVQRVHASTVMSTGYYTQVDFQKVDKKVFDWMRPVNF